MDVNKVRHCDLEDIRQEDDNAAQLLEDSSSLVQAHSISDPVFAPVGKLPIEILAKIFIECIPSKILSFWGDSVHPQQICGRLRQVCQVWNAILLGEPGVWATLVLDRQLSLEIVSLWIKRSKSHPLDVQLYSWYGDMDELDGYIDGIVEMIRRELWRIRSFFARDFFNYYGILQLFPPDLSTEAPMMENLMLEYRASFPEGRWGHIHCPQLRSLTLCDCDIAVESLISQPMRNLRVVTIIDSRGSDNMLYIKLLQALPNLVSLTWGAYGLRFHEGISRVALPSLKSLTFQVCRWESMTRLLRYLDVPSLEYLDLEHFHLFNVDEGRLNMVLNDICGHGTVQLRRLTLGDRALRGANLHAMWHHLKYLETLYISGSHRVASVEELLIALSPPNRDFSSVCPRLKTLELSNVEISTSTLVDFVERRVKSDLDDVAPGLVTCLRLSNMSVDEEVSAQLAKTHSLSVHLLGC